MLIKANKIGTSLVYGTEGPLTVEALISILSRFNPKTKIHDEFSMDLNYVKVNSLGIITLGNNEVSDDTKEPCNCGLGYPNCLGADCPAL